MPSRSKSVLLVEDNPDMRAVLREGLEGEGYEVIETNNATEALPLVPHLERLGLILLDWSRWSDTGAARLIQDVRRMPSHANVCIILLSVEAGRNAPLPGAQGVLQKPFTFGRLMEVVAASCG